LLPLLHARIATLWSMPDFPHYKHVSSQDNLQPAAEITPAEILASIKAQLS